MTEPTALGGLPIVRGIVMVAIILGSTAAWNFLGLPTGTAGLMAATIMFSAGLIVGLSYRYADGK